MRRNRRSLCKVTLGGVLMLLTAASIASAQAEQVELTLAARLERSTAFWQARVARNPDA